MQEIKWFGNAGHFCCGQWCRFHLTTLANGYLISTVGEYVHPRHGQGSEVKEAAWLKDNWPGEEIGFGRKYETMVFKAGNPCDSPECGCGLPSIDGLEIDGQGYNTAKEATEGHMFLVEKYKNKDAPQQEELDELDCGPGQKKGAGDVHRHTA